jgi:hypothetical protein
VFDKESLYRAGTRRMVSTSGRFMTLTASMAVIFLYVVIIPIGSFNLTIGSVLCGLFVFYRIINIRSIDANIVIAGFFIIYPAVVMLAFELTNSPLAPDGPQFFRSYSLWVVSVLAISLSFSKKRIVVPRGIFTLILLILALMAAQTFGKSFGTSIGYDIIIPLLRIDASKSYLDLANTTRAIGFYYEPSMCGRVLTTLCFIDYSLSGKTLRNLAVWVACLLLTQSIGVIILGAVLSLVLIARSTRGILVLIIFSVFATVLAMPFVASRMERESQNTDESSSYRRTQAPLETIKFSIASYPAGVPIGSAETLAHLTGYDKKTGEIKITNGTYEFATYFGVISFIIIGVLIYLSIYYISIGNRERAAAIIYIMISTALSGSYLSIESSLLTGLFIGGMMVSEQRKREIDIDQPVSQ